MSTRSAIGIINENGTVNAIRCFYDGYPNGVGEILYKYYKRNDIYNLLAYGELASLKPNILECESFKDNNGFLTFDSLEDFLKNGADRNYHYFIGLNNEWYGVSLIWDDNLKQSTASIKDVKDLRSMINEKIVD